MLERQWQQRRRHGNQSTSADPPLPRGTSSDPPTRPRRFALADTVLDPVLRQLSCEHLATSSCRWSDPMDRPYACGPSTGGVHRHGRPVMFGVLEGDAHHASIAACAGPWVQAGCARHGPRHDEDAPTSRKEEGGFAAVRRARRDRAGCPRRRGRQPPTTGQGPTASPSRPSPPRRARTDADRAQGPRPRVRPPVDAGGRA